MKKRGTKHRAEQAEYTEEEQAEVLPIPSDVWKWLVLPRLRTSEVRAVGRCGGIAWLALLAAQRLRSIIVLRALFQYSVPLLLLSRG